MDDNVLDESIIKKRVGRTPLIRVKNLEKELGISNIYLKLEGNNPSGHREDRLAYLLLKDAISINKTTLCLGSIGVLAKSLIFLSKYYNVDFVFVLPKNRKKIKILNSPNIKIIRYGKNEKESIEHSHKLSEENNWYNANPGIQNKLLNMSALSYITDELNNRINGKIDTVFSQMSYGYSISGLHLGFRNLWINEKIEKLPMLFSCTTNLGNIIYESYKKDCRKIGELSLNNVKSSRYNKHLISLESSVAQNALNAIYDTNGQIIGLSDEELVEYVNIFRKIESIKFDITNGFSIAGFLKKAENGDIKDGNHVILLNDGKIHLEIQQVSKEDNIISDEKIVELVNKWLMEYTDPVEEIQEALNNAFEKGFVLFAYHDNDLCGISIIVNLGFNNFATNYHLAYIATKKDIKGRGIATQLINKSIELTNGNISLHVEKENRRAIKLYEKMGFESSYNRMIYKK